MRSPLRRSTVLLLFLLLLLLCFFASFLFLAVVPSDFSTPLLERNQLIGENSVIRQSAEKLNSIKQEISGRFKVPTGVFSKNRSIENGVVRGLQDDGAGKEVERQQNLANSGDRGMHEQSNLEAVGVQSKLPQQQPLINEKVSEMEDQIIVAKTYLQFAPSISNSHLVRELKLRIKEVQRVLGQAKGSNLPRGASQRMRAMEDTLSKAQKAYPDCSAMASKTRAMFQNTEEQLWAQRNQASYLIQLSASTFPKGLHCLSMLLTTEYFTLKPEDRKLPTRAKVQNADLHHYAIFSDNILACAVVVNSTVFTSQKPEKMVFHVVTDSLNFQAMTMWFLMNTPGRATIQIRSMDEFEWLPHDFISLIKQPGVRDPRYMSPLNHLRFYLPDVFPYLDKILLLDHDVVVKKDLRELWNKDMKGKVISVIETCNKDDSSHRLDMLVDFSEPTIAKKFDAKACLWAFGMNMFDLQEWRRRGLTQTYNKWLQLGKKRRQTWKAGSLPLGQLTFYNHTVSIERQWHVLGLGQDSNINRREIERAAVIHYSGNRKPWLEIGIPRFRGYWSKFLNYNQHYLQQCNIHE